MLEKEVREPNMYPAVEAVHARFEAYAVGGLVSIGDCEVLGFLEERQEAVPCPVRIVVEGTPDVVLLFLCARLIEPSEIRG